MSHSGDVMDDSISASVLGTFPAGFPYSSPSVYEQNKICVYPKHSFRRQLRERKLSNTLIELVIRSRTANCSQKTLLELNWKVNNTFEATAG